MILKEMMPSQFADTQMIVGGCNKIILRTKKAIYKQ
jgi:hypothetical protein